MVFGSPVIRFAVFAFIAMAVFAAIVAWQVSARIEQDALADVVEDVQETLSARITGHLSAEVMAGPLLGADYETFHRFVRESVVSGRIARIKIWNRDGLIVYSDDPSLVGATFAIGADLKMALNGRTAAEISTLEAEENVNEKASFERLLEVYVPIRLDGQNEVVGAYEAYFLWAPVAGRIAETQRMVLGWLSVGSLLLYLIALAFLDRAARTIGRLFRQSEKRAGELEIAHTNLMEAHLATLETLAAAVEARDPYTHGHALRVRDYACALARELGCGDESELEILRRAAVLHDIGKIGLADSILRKPDRLDPSEYQQMKTHPELGGRLLQRISFLRGEIELVRHHHERYDGLGYPDGLAGERIPLGARILQVADAFDAMTSNRPYRQSLSVATAREELVKNAGVMFCPAVVNAMLTIVDREFTLAPT